MLGDWVRLRGAYVIRADDGVRDASGALSEVLASVVPDTLGVDPPAGIKPRGVIHWVAAENAVDCAVRLYERLFSAPEPDAGDGDFRAGINPDSLVTLTGCKAEANLGRAAPEVTFQFTREGYFFRDSFCGDRDNGNRLVFNRPNDLRDASPKPAATKPRGTEG